MKSSFYRKNTYCKYYFFKVASILVVKSFQTNFCIICDILKTGQSNLTESVLTGQSVMPRAMAGLGFLTLLSRISFGPMFLEFQREIWTHSSVADYLVQVRNVKNCPKICFWFIHTTQKKQGDLKLKLAAPLQGKQSF